MIPIILPIAGLGGAAGIYYLWRRSMQMPQMPAAQGYEPIELKDFTRSGTASKLGIDNTPSPTAVPRLMLSLRMANIIGQKYGLKGSNITSGYRNEAVNKAVGGVSGSHHTTGYAFDFNLPGGRMAVPRDAIELADWLDSIGEGYDQIMVYGDKGHIHVSVDPKARKEVLFRTPKQGGGYNYQNLR